MTSPPFSPGTVSVGLYTTSRDAASMIDDVLSQAEAARAAGFDGVTISEHHAGFPSYVPNPLQMSGWILDRIDDIWAGACPFVLPLRRAAIVGEEAAWLHALHPGRVGLGVAPGYAPGDFEAVGVDHSDRVGLFESNLERLARVVRGDDARLGDDPAVAALATTPIPLVAAAGSSVAARRAARHGVGMITDSLAPPTELQRRFQVYRDAGGTGPLVINRRAWIGPSPDTLLARQYSTWQREGGATAPDTRGAHVLSGDAETVAEQLVDVVAATGADHVGLKVFIEGMSNDDVVAQILGFGAALRFFRSAVPTQPSPEPQQR